MKAKSFTPLFFALSCAISLAFTMAARADDDGELGGEIEGTETLDAEIAMTPTAAAPAGSMAQVSLEAEDEDGSTSAKLEVEAQGLMAGTYSVGVTLKSNGSTVILGTFTVDNEGEGKFELGDEDEAAFPPNFNPLDIATVFIADANSVVLFTADLTSVASGSSMNLNATVMMVAGPANPNASGTATLTAFGSRGGPKGSVQLTASGLPPNLPVVVAFNGVTSNGKKIKTNMGGSLSVNLSSKGKAGMVASGVNLFHVTSLTLRDKFGNLLMSADF